MAQICKHDRLARACEMCDMEAEIAELKAEIERMRTFMSKRTFDGENTELEIYEWLEGDA